MSVIPVKSFSGMVPRVPAHLLQPNQAQSAYDCDFTHGELRPLKGAFFIKQLSNSAKGLFTQDGILFYSWTQDVNAYRSPVVTDVNNRLYYSGVNGDSLVGQMTPGVRVTTTGGMSVYGGVPPAGSDYYAGVPAAGTNYDGNAYAPTVFLRDATDLPGVTNPGVSIAFWYEDGGKQYQYTASIPFTETQRLKKYRISIPALSQPDVTSSNPTTGVYASAIAVNTQDSQGNWYEVDTPINGNITITSGSTVTYSGTNYSNVLAYFDKSGVRQDLMSAVTQSQEAQGSPSSATPQVEVSVTNTDTGELVYRTSTSPSNRDVSNIKGNLSVSLQKVDATNYDVVISYGTAETRAYVYTLVNAWGEEGVPSPATIVNVSSMQYAQIEGVVLPTASKYVGYKPINRARLYRSNTSSTGTTAYQFVEEITVPGTDGTILFTDTKRAEELGEVLPSDIWDCPPKNLTNLTQLPNGVFAASWGNTIYFSVPYRPWAWPSSWAITIPYSVTGMMPMGNSLLATTTAFPYLVNGAYPDSFVSSRIPLSQAGIWQRGTVDLGGNVAYISHDGIVMLRGTQGGLDASQRFFTRDDWRTAYGPSISNFTNLRLIGYEGRIMGLRPTGYDGFLIDVDEGGGAMTKVRTYVNGLFISPETDQAYITDTSGNLYQLFGGTSGSYVWQSKDFIIARPTNFGALQLILAPGSGSVTFTVYADGVAKTTKTISASGIYRLASGFKARRWSVKLEGNATVREMYIANVPTELENV